ATLQRARHGGGQRVAGDLARVALRIEDPPARLTVGFRPVQRDVGGAHQVVRVGAGDAAFHHADACRDGQVVALDPERLAEQGHHPVGDLDRVIHAGGVFHQYHELVTAQAGHEVPELGGEPAQPGAGGDQQLIADRVPQAVVDRFEGVQVDEAHAQPDVRSG